MTVLLQPCRSRTACIMLQLNPGVLSAGSTTALPIKHKGFSRIHTATVEIIGDAWRLVWQWNAWQWHSSDWSDARHTQAVLMHSRSTWLLLIQRLFVLTDSGRSNQILFRAATAQNQYNIRRPDEFEICTQSGYWSAWIKRLLKAHVDLQIDMQLETHKSTIINPAQVKKNAREWR